MADLTGYTAMTDLHGGWWAQEMVIEFLKAVEESLAGDWKLFQIVVDQAIVISALENGSASNGIKSLTSPDGRFKGPWINFFPVEKICYPALFHRNLGRTE